VGREGDRSGEKQEEEKAGKVQSAEERALDLSHKLIGIESHCFKLETDSLKNGPTPEAV
jgi:hypothetical protein